jgi:hypothetical protein
VASARNLGVGQTLVKPLVKMMTRSAFKALKSWDIIAMAEREGFEPSVRFHAHTLSKRAP